MNEITIEIQKLMTVVKNRASGSPQKKELNKVYARLEEAWLWSKQIEPSSGELASGSALPAFSRSCICPTPDSRDSSCMAH